MVLAPGSRLGPYEVLAVLGAGGMGEVYRVRDPRLNRLVAIKVLPGAAAADAERRERFEREAQSIAALNHPNIVTIHSVEQADDQFFLTMELVEGRSLADAMPPAGLPLERLLPLLVCELPDCAPRPIARPPNFGGLPHWMPGGRAVAYVDTTQFNLWTQSPDSGPPRQLTHFNDGRTITGFAWSRDGRRLAIARSMTTNDIVLFKGLKR